MAFKDNIGMTEELHVEMVEELPEVSDEIVEDIPEEDRESKDDQN